MARFIVQACPYRLLCEAGEPVSINIVVVRIEVLDRNPTIHICFFKGCSKQCSALNGILCHGDLVRLSVSGYFTVCKIWFGWFLVLEEQQSATPQPVSITAEHLLVAVTRSITLT